MFRFVCIVFLFSSLAFSQISKVVSAHKNANYREARLLIDSLLLISNNVLNPEYLYVKGMVYETIFLKNDTLINYINENCLKVAFDSYKKASQTGTNSLFTKLSTAYLDTSFSKKLLESAINSATKNNLIDAIEFSKMYIDIKPKDTLGYINLKYYSSKASDYPNEKFALTKLLEINYMKLKNYQILLDVMEKNEKKNDEILKYLAFASTEFPNEIFFKKYRINLFLKEKKYKNAISSIDSLSKLDNSNQSEYLYKIGSIYHEMDSTYLAVDFYKKAISLNPELFEAYYNLGGIYYEKARKIYDKINSLEYAQYQKIGKKLENEANTIVTEALPYFEKAWGIEKRESLKFLLADIYRNLKMSARVDLK
jgi:tetratricopeptide (TPR) repeat protein